MRYEINHRNKTVNFYIEDKSESLSFNDTKRMVAELNRKTESGLCCTIKENLQLVEIHPDALGYDERGHGIDEIILKCKICGFIIYDEGRLIRNE